MTWAFDLPLEPRAKIALLAIADNADDSGVAWPSRDLIAQKSSQSRATVNRRMAYLAELEVLTVHERFREDGSQTTDEIRLNLALSSDEVGRRVKALDTAETIDRGCQVAAPPVQMCSPGVSDVQPPGTHCGNPQSEPSVEPDRIGDARARVSMFTDGSKALASAFWKALGINRPLDIPHQFAGIDHRAVMWEQHGWDVDLIETEARRFAGDDPPKPITYFEKVFATAFAKRQAPLPIVEVRQAEKLTVTHHGTSQSRTEQGSGIIQAADRLVATLESFDEGAGGHDQQLRGEAGQAPVRLLSKG